MSEQFFIEDDIIVIKIKSDHTIRLVENYDSLDNIKLQKSSMMIIDLTDMDYLNSTGMARILSFCNKATRKIAFVVRTDSIIHKMMDILNANKIIDIFFDDYEAAKEFLKLA